MNAGFVRADFPQFMQTVKKARSINTHSLLPSLPNHVAISAMGATPASVASRLNADTTDF
jgi:hypothetical protein